MKKDNIPYDEFDPEVVELCRAINDLPGVRTTESCCGHGKSTFIIFFRVDPKEQRGLFMLTRCVDRRYFIHGHSWNITLSVGDAVGDPPDYKLPLAFLLESTTCGELAYIQSQDLVDNIISHRKHKAFLEVYRLQEFSLE